MLVLTATLLAVALVPTTHARASSLSGGVELDALGDLTSFGGNTTNTSGASHWTWDIARSLSIESDGSGGWTLDGWGGIHPFGNAPQITDGPYWQGWDIARALVVLPGTVEGYVLDGWGGLHPFGGAPWLNGSPYWNGKDVARGLDIHLDGSGTPDGGAILDDAGAIHPFGDYPYSLKSTTTYPGRDAFAALHEVSGHVYAVGRYGVVVEQTAGQSMTPDYSGFADWGESDLLRDLVVTSPSGGSSMSPSLSFMAQRAWAGVIGPRGGVTLDGFGGLNAFGGLQLNTAGAPYWPGWDIARSLVVLPDGSGGWELDGLGGVHPFGSAGALSGTPVWPRWDIARSLVVNPDGTSGYVLDGWGGLHPFGGAPMLNGSPYWYGDDVARGLAIHYTPSGDPDGGWVLDAYGGIHAFGAAPDEPQPSYFAGRNLYLQLNSTFDGGLYTVSRWQEIAGLDESTIAEGLGDGLFS
ncbi:MAG: hypothetical protein JOY68_08055 [Candidatus Dormibacteraeota bacterium]|nr:hypothetical protein [Candidatus Dormibacteraeota bacterium]